jgi:hypothetical protein
VTSADPTVCSGCGGKATEGVCWGCTSVPCRCSPIDRIKGRDWRELERAADGTSRDELERAGEGRRRDDEGRLQVKASHRNPIDVADEVAEYLLENNDPPHLFSMSPAAVVLRNGALVPLDPDGWLEYVARRVTFVVPTRTGTQMVAPPAAVMKLIPPW